MLEGKVVERPEPLTIKAKNCPETLVYMDSGKGFIRINVGIISISIPSAPQTINKLIDWLKDAKRYSMSLERVGKKNEHPGD